MYYMYTYTFKFQFACKWERYTSVNDTLIIKFHEFSFFHKFYNFHYQTKKSENYGGRSLSKETLYIPLSTNERNRWLYLKPIPSFQLCYVTITSSIAYRNKKLLHCPTTLEPKLLQILVD